jgi:hypothetical protein
MIMNAGATKGDQYTACVSTGITVASLFFFLLLLIIIYQGLFAEAFVALMDGVGDSLSAKNRDLFTQNLAVFRRDISNQPKSAAPAPVTYEAMDRNDSSDYY